MSKDVKAVIYARYSSSGQREESIEGQIRECREYAERNGIAIVGEYIDKALTGRTDKRPDFQRMMKDSEKQAFNMVICWKTDRFARNRYDAAMYKAKLKKNGVALCYAKEVIPEGPEGIILESVMEGYAEYYSANLSQNVKRGNYESALALKTLGQKVLGYRKGADGRFEIDPLTVPIVQRIFTEYSRGEKAKDIYARLNAEGFRTMQGKPFSKSSITYILTNEKYVGVYEFKDIRVEGGVPPIVDRETFDKCQRLIGQHRIAPAAKRETKFLLTTKLCCGLCGKPMTGESGTSQNGASYYYYICNGRKTKKCTKERAPKTWIETLVVDKLTELLHSVQFINEVVDKCLEYQEREFAENAELKALEQRRREKEKAINNMAAAIEQGVITKTTTTRLVELESELEDIDKAIAQHTIENPRLSREQIEYFFDKLRQGDADDEDYKQRLIDTFLNKVYLYDDDKLILVLNYTGENSKVTLQITEKAIERGSPGSSLEGFDVPNASKTNTQLFFFKKVFAIVVRFKR